MEERHVVTVIEQSDWRLGLEAGVLVAEGWAGHASLSVQAPAHQATPSPLTLFIVFVLFYYTNIC